MQVYSMDDDKDIQGLKDKIDQLNQQAWQLRVNDSGQAHLLSKEAIDVAEEINYDRGKAEGYRTYGFSLIRLSRHHEALGFCEKSLALFESLNDQYGQSSVYEYFGIIYRSLGNYGKSLEYLFKALEITEQLKFDEGKSLTLYHLGVTYKYLGNYHQALEYVLKSLSLAQLNNYWVSESYALNLIGQIYNETGDYEKAIDYYQQSLLLRKKAGDRWGEAGCLDNIGSIHYKLNDFEKAFDFSAQSLVISQSINDRKGEANALLHHAKIYKRLNDSVKAEYFGYRSLDIRKNIGDKKGHAEILLFLADLGMCDLNENNKTVVIKILDEALQLGNEINASDILSKIHFSYYSIQKHFHCFKEALLHFELFMEAEKKLHKNALNEKIQNLEISYKAEQARNEAQIYRLKNVELAKLYEESIKQKNEIEQQKKMAEHSLTELKATQRQLIQSEKMASLGELTAGIAHEIQNPLNFVNNFSEVSNELIDEMNMELDKGEIEEAKAIAADIKQNLEKINHHGKRADAIVKGMLQHSRSSSGVKEPTDINALADEYLRLSYHGLRAKDKNFNAELKTDFDSSIGKINIIPQDIGRVLLNLFNNAFYACTERSRASTSSAGQSYEPTVLVTTKKSENSVIITVSDNGNGISQKIVDKIFQPFFTTKPTGQGTGLGLSLSYDIVKAHGGEIRVETKEGEGTEFTIILPSA
jgi:two-component system NtrC family sensor kinase